MVSMYEPKENEWSMTVVLVNTRAPFCLLKRPTLKASCVLKASDDCEAPVLAVTRAPSVISIGLVCIVQHFRCAFRVHLKCLDNVVRDVAQEQARVVRVVSAIACEEHATRDGELMVAVAHVTVDCLKEQHTISLSSPAETEETQIGTIWVSLT